MAASCCAHDRGRTSHRRTASKTCRGHTAHTRTQSQAVESVQGIENAYLARLKTPTALVGPLHSNQGLFGSARGQDLFAKDFPMRVRGQKMREGEGIPWIRGHATTPTGWVGLGPTFIPLGSMPRQGDWGTAQASPRPARRGARPFGQPRGRRRPEARQDVK
ncbi:hypothetical protein LX36DRAFT_403656 [Colletotrichum falcatum]|nr:hypothetical protein LX36DRAFT_403656 [Colletotrichum falcatum]